MGVPRPWPLADLQVRLSLVGPWLVQVRLSRLTVSYVALACPRFLPRLVLHKLGR